MAGAGYISRPDSIEAIEEPMPRRWPMAPMVESGLTGPSQTRDFAEMVQEELISKYGVNTVLQGGLSVYTTLDLEAQVTARDILYAPDGYLPSVQSPDAALVSMDPETGHITAIVGNRDPKSQFNLATQGRRQPGSSFKPFALLAALEQGIDPNTKFVSERKTYQVDVGTDEPERWRVRNYDGIERGTISLKEALWWSDNTVFTDLVMNTNGKGLEDGPEAIADVANRLGISTNFPDHPNPSIVLGAYEVSPLDMATAYATIANGGRLMEPTVISKVVSDEGEEGEKVLYEAPAHPEGRQVIDPEIAHEATEIMIGDVTEGIAEDASLGERPVAGKTGTSENFFDAWFVGYTPQLLTGIWMGYAEGGQTLGYDLEYARELNGLSGGITPAQIWKTYMEQTLEGKPIEQFEGVEMPTQEQTTPTDSEPPGTKPSNAVGPAAVEPLPAGALGDDPMHVEPSSASPSSAAPSSASPSTVSPSSASPSRRSGGRGLR
jgi:membrane peptidoglycan carboxypeptidase